MSDPMSGYPTVYAQTLADSYQVPEDAVRGYVEALIGLEATADVMYAVDLASVVLAARSQGVGQDDAMIERIMTRRTAYRARHRR